MDANQILTNEGWEQVPSSIVGGHFKNNYKRGNDSLYYSSETGLYYFKGEDGKEETWEFNEERSEFFSVEE